MLGAQTQQVQLRQAGLFQVNQDTSLTPPPPRHQSASGPQRCERKLRNERRSLFSVVRLQDSCSLAPVSSPETVVSGFPGDAAMAGL